jgi:hypothetical protein
MAADHFVFQLWWIALNRPTKKPRARAKTKKKRIWIVYRLNKKKEDGLLSGGSILFGFKVWAHQLGCYIVPKELGIGNSGSKRAQHVMWESAKHIIIYQKYKSATESERGNSPWSSPTPLLCNDGGAAVGDSRDDETFGSRKGKLSVDWKWKVIRNR